MNVLSLFDGLSGGSLALEEAHIPVTNYYASEVDKYAVQVSTENYPDIVHLGDVRNVSAKNLPKIDLLIGGSPCQDLSVAKIVGKGLEGTKSKLFYEYVRLLEECKPKYFLLENVASMRKTDKQIITDIVGVEPITINSKLVSALERKRHYWTNIPGVQQPKDLNIKLRDVIDRKVEEKFYFSEATELSMQKIMARSEAKGLGFRTGIIDESDFDVTKFKNLDANYHKGCDGKRTMLQIEGRRRMATPTEAERLMTVPEGYTSRVSNTQRYRMLGNGWTTKVLAHIFSYIPKAL